MTSLWYLNFLTLIGSCYMELCADVFGFFIADALCLSCMRSGQFLLNFFWIPIEKTPEILIVLDRPGINVIKINSLALYYCWVFRFCSSFRKLGKTHSPKHLNPPSVNLLSMSKWLLISVSEGTNSSRLKRSVTVNLHLDVISDFLL